MPVLDSFHVISATLYYGNVEIAALTDLTRHAHAPVPPSRIRQWRPTAHNLVVHPLYGDAITIATDGVHTLIDIKDGHSVEVACGSLKGPILGWPVQPSDWDWDRNSRKVHVFRRGNDQPPAIIPVNTWMDKYWDTFEQLSTFEHQAYAALATWGGPPASEFDNILAQLVKTKELTEEQQFSEKLRRTKQLNQRVAELLADL